MENDEEAMQCCKFSINAGIDCASSPDDIDEMKYDARRWTLSTSIAAKVRPNEAWDRAAIVIWPLIDMKPYSATPSL